MDSSIPESFISLISSFKTDFVANTKALTVGNPLDENTKVGAIVSKPHQQKILS